ncbi:LysR family transcriptional regulator [Klebsiella sp. GG_Kp153]|jgi:DNA-binding transcriptional LysR family regulator|nr:MULTISPECIES: LysR family transcriptional regulator [Pseudomonadota]KCB41692.1 transcriptional regulator, LysR family [Bordetella hinzii 5132]MCE0033147.1 LysR family transcriptional regulator [Klebsiella pneumoniae]MCX2622336.1 LysR family transcriptional regulator [Klebsiella pneumoniae]MDE4626764.1 LysR family transcriptional regulator [Klebsiella pneumoniae]MDK1889434.1 LysR family transcriptional regulator [Klebsiella sp. K5-210]
MKKHDMGLLVSLDVLLEEANVTRAARRLAISQPALSAQLARLRQVLDDPLLVPAERGRGMRLTPRAAQLKSPLHELLTRLEDLVEAPYAFDPSTAKRDFTIALNDNAAMTIGLDLIECIRKQSYAGIRLAMLQIPRDEVLDLAARGRIDLVIGTRAFMPPGLRTHDLVDDRFQVAQRKGHPRGTAAMTLEQYCAYEHVLVSTNGSYHSGIDDFLAELGHYRHTTVSVQYYTAVPPILERTNCLATLPERFLHRFDHMIDRFDLPFAFDPFQLQVGWHPRFDEDLGHQWLREQLIAVRSVGFHAELSQLGR